MNHQNKNIDLGKIKNWKCANSNRKIRQNLRMIKNGRLSEQQLKVTVTNLLTITFTTFQHHVLKIYHPRKNGPAIKHQNERNVKIKRFHFKNIQLYIYLLIFRWKSVLILLKQILSDKIKKNFRLKIFFIKSILTIIFFGSGFATCWLHEHG